MIPPDNNSDFVANMEMVLDVYKQPYNPEFPVVCMDESPKQLIKETNERRFDSRLTEKKIDEKFMTREEFAKFLKEIPEETEFDFTSYDALREDDGEATQPNA